MRRLSNELIQLGDGFSHLGPKLFVAARGGLSAGERAFDPLECALGAVEGSGKAGVVHE